MFLLCIGALGAAAAVIGAVIYANLPTRWTIGAVLPTVAHLKTASLIKINDEKNIDKGDAISGSEFLSKPSLVMAIRRPGCILCRREAAHLSELKPLLDKAGVRLVGVVHEYKGVNDFKSFFNGDVYLDTKRTFYGPNERWLPIWMGALRLGTYVSGAASTIEGFSGNFKGEGRLLGGVYLVDGKEMVWSHLESAWGDKVDVEEVRSAIEQYMKRN